MQKYKTVASVQIDERNKHKTRNTLSRRRMRSESGGSIQRSVFLGKDLGRIDCVKETKIMLARKLHILKVRTDKILTRYLFSIVLINFIY